MLLLINLMQALPPSVVNLAAVLFLLLLSWLSATMSWYLQYLYSWHPIGRRYKRLLRWTAYKTRRKPWLQSLTKPLGLCVYCQSTWVAILTGIFFLTEYHAIFFLMHLGATYFFVERTRHWCQ